MSSLVLIGSRAMSQRMPFHPRTNTDFDFIGKYEDMNAFIRSQGGIKECYPLNKNKYVIKTNNGIIEYEIAWPGSTGEEFMNMIVEGPEKVLLWNDYIVPNLDLLYTLKMSHRYLKNSPHFLKTMEHIHLMRNHGAKIRPEYQEWYKRRMDATYNYAHPKLNQGKNTFFAGDGVEYVYDHDSIHEAVAISGTPAYRLFAKDGEQVLSSKEKFFALDQYQQVNAVLEESYVLALERSQIPFPDTNPTKSFKMALMKVCTSITSGWFREFAWEHYYHAMDRFNPSYVIWFQNGLKRGIVKPYTGVQYAQ